jgi:MFS family permease
MVSIASRFDDLWDYGFAQGKRVLWWLLPENDVLANRAFQLILASRFLAETGQQALQYGALVAIVREGGGSFESALIGVAASLPAATISLFGGAVADTFPRRVALVVGYLLQGLACLLVPFLYGVELGALVALILVVGVFGQLSGPSEQSIVPLVVNDHQLATANSFKDLASSAGQVVGTAFLAPILVKAFGVTPVIYLSGVLLVLAGVRLFALRTRRGRRKVQLRLPGVTTVAGAVPWLRKERAVAAMLVLAVLAGTASLIVTALGPQYVQTVLDADAANTVYVFAPAAIGGLAALSFVPRQAARAGERKAAVAGFFIVTLTLLGFGLINPLAELLGPLNPLTALGLSEEVATAALLALPFGFGITTVAAAVQTYFNRYVPELLQGRVFALQSALKNGVAIVPLLVLGALATAVGVETVLLIFPIIMLGLALVFAAESYRWALEGFEPDPRLWEIPLTQWVWRRVSGRVEGGVPAEAPGPGPA